MTSSACTWSDVAVNTAGCLFSAVTYRPGPADSIEIQHASTQTTRYSKHGIFAIAALGRL
jgi:hypothetical protein